jgi:predicted nucleic acid-binding protein
LALTAYLDASVLVALFTDDPFSEQADRLLRKRLPNVDISDFVAAEFVSAIGRRVRMDEISREQAGAAFAAFDAWAAQETRRIETISADIVAADALLRRLDLNLRTPDAINIAIAQRLDADLMTFDAKMAANAGVLGLTLYIA